MNPSDILRALAQLGMAALEKIPEVRTALAPYLHARVVLTVRVDLELDGPAGPLPDPVVEVRQSAVVTLDGVHLDGVPTFRVAAG